MRITIEINEGNEPIAKPRVSVHPQETFGDQNEAVVSVSDAGASPFAEGETNTESGISYEGEPLASIGNIDGEVDNAGGAPEQ